MRFSIATVMLLISLANSSAFAMQKYEGHGMFVDGNFLFTGLVGDIRQVQDDGTVEISYPQMAYDDKWLPLKADKETGISDAATYVCAVIHKKPVSQKIQDVQFQGNTNLTLEEKSILTLVKPDGTIIKGYQTGKQLGSVTCK